ncbi:type III secretion system inner membrane ring subunit SctD [Pseudomonas aeruginosa]
MPRACACWSGRRAASLARTARRKSPERSCRRLPGRPAARCAGHSATRSGVFPSVSPKPRCRPRQCAASRPPVPAGPGCSASAKVRAYLREQGMSEVDVQRQGDSLLLGGYLEDNARRLALQRYLDGSGVDYRLEARSMEDIRQGVDFILQKFGYRQILSSNADKPGWVRLNGELAEQDERWARIDALLESEVPGLLGVENQVRVAGSHLRRLERLLADAGLDRQLSFRERGERIELSGTLDEVQLSAFYRLQREFQQEFGNRPSLELLSRGKRASGDELEFTVRSVSLGRVPYVVLGDGQKYPVGASTSRGVRILAIEPESILVARGKQRFIINLKGEVLHDDSLGNATVGR